MKTQQTVADAAAKPRYDLLDGLRGVAAILVIWYHFGEGFATNAVDQMLNHGYLAVDFFFVLSGFVIGYSYDGRWQRGMTSGNFMLRRIIRLQPMVVLSVIFGAIAFLVQGSVKWDGTAVPLGYVALSLLLALFFIPSHPMFASDVRGNGEMFPLNGPSWSLFFEYIGSLLYAIWLHRLSTRALRVVVLVSAIGLAVCALYGNISGGYSTGFGWSMGIDGLGLVGGFFRLSFSFSVGLLMTRGFRRRSVRGAFWIASALIVAAMYCPYVGSPDGATPSAVNAVYDLCCTFFLFPAVVYIGACGMTTDKFSNLTCEFLGRMSYPVYIIHYPIMYLFYSWVWANGLSFADVWPVCIGLFVVIMCIAWTAMKFYDEPLRKWLTARLIGK